jgi:transglutaminase-like putative cysteine protease
VKYRVSHSTTYSYGSPVSLSHNQVRLVPRDDARRRCLISRQNVSPTPTVVQSWIDFFGNIAGYFMIDQPHRELVVTSESTVEVGPVLWLAAEATPAWDAVRDQVRNRGDDAALEASFFTFDSVFAKAGAEFAEYALPSFTVGRPLDAAVLDLTERIHRDFSYDPTATAVSTPTLDVLRSRRGVCQDFAHLEIACLRSLGLAARYVSGYLQTDPPPGRPRLIGADASHAWISVWCPGIGWLDFDPTNACQPAERHVLIAWGRDYVDVAPIKGVVLGGGAHVMSVSVDVTPLEA